MSKQVSNTISSCYYHIKDLRRIRRHLTKSVAITLCNALVGSKINYCNSLYYGINDKQMQRLQGVQNTLCHIVTHTHRFSSITGPLITLHWLPVKSFVQFKLGLITYKVYKNKYPAFLENYVQTYRSKYHTRRSEPARHILSIPHYNYKQHKSFTHLSNNFFYSAPRLWKSLPETCRCASSLGCFELKLKLKFRIIYRRLYRSALRAYRGTHVGAFNLEF